MPQGEGLFDDFDAALQRGSSDERVALLRQLIDRQIIKSLGPLDDGLLIPCRAADCASETVGAIAACKLLRGPVPQARHQKLKIVFTKRSISNAQRLLRFWQVRETSARSA